MEFKQTKINCYLSGFIRLAKCTGQWAQSSEHRAQGTGHRAKSTEYRAQRKADNDKKQYT